MRFCVNVYACVPVCVCKSAHALTWHRLTASYPSDGSRIPVTLRGEARVAVQARCQDRELSGPVVRVTSAPLLPVTSPQRLLPSSCP